MERPEAWPAPEWPEPDRPDDPASPTTLSAAQVGAWFVYLATVRGYIERELERCARVAPIEGAEDDGSSPAPSGER